MTTPTLPRDARSTTWQFVAPGHPGQLLAVVDPLDCPDDAVPVAATDLSLHRRPAGWPAVAAPDLGAASALAGVGAATMLELLAGQVAGGGWLLFGVANTWYPTRGGARGRLSLAAIRREVHRAGLEVEALYVALPDHRRPAVLAAAGPARALDEVLHRLPTDYVEPGAHWRSARRRVRSLLAHAASTAPHAARLRLVPAYVVVARRPA
ncbi:MAG TPA: hypothetical protein VGK60_07140 [Pedococcus sp.]